jgi:hypothetical protein
MRTFNAFETPQGNKLTNEHELCSQKFQREDFGDDEPSPDGREAVPDLCFTFPPSTRARNLFGAEGCFAQSGGDTEG